MTTQEDFTVETNEVEAVTTQPEIEDSAEAINTQEDYDNLLLEKERLEIEKENYRKAALKYKKVAKSLDNDEDLDIEVKEPASKSFTADEVAEIATKAAKAALEEERKNTEIIQKVNSELKRTLAGKAPENGTSGEGIVDTTKSETPYFNEEQKAFLQKLGVTEEDVLKTKQRNKRFFM